MQTKSTNAKSFWPLALLNSTYYWYLVTEGQITPLFIVTTFLMTIIWLYQRFVQKNRLDINGRFLLFTFHLTIILVAVWTSLFWNDKVLRTKYASSLIYVPEPWSVYSLYGKRFF
jgi:ceroid-lipofuscinosis protein 6